MALPYYDLLNEVLEPPHHMKPEWGEDQLQRAMKSWNTNSPQAGAILSAVGSHGFSLIQGPPGTGKTKTILGLVGAFISNRGRRPNQHSQAPEKILLCAPSNAAVDEVAKRLKEGVFDSNGNKIVPKVVRIGAGSSINVSVADVFLDNLVEKQLAGATGQTIAGDAQNNINTARSSLVALKAQREEKKAEKANALTNTALMIKLGGEISMLTSQINDLGDRLDRERDRLTQSNRAMESQKRKVRAEILADADVICATLSGSGHDYLANIDFETVIIDEAAQSVEISSLIPLKYNCQRCIMVGGKSGR
jgi:senataxin